MGFCHERNMSITTGGEMTSWWDPRYLPLYTQCLLCLCQFAEQLSSILLLHPKSIHSLLQAEPSKQFPCKWESQASLGSLCRCSSYRSEANTGHMGKRPVVSWGMGYIFQIGYFGGPPACSERAICNLFVSQLCASPSYSEVIPVFSVLIASLVLLSPRVLSPQGSPAKKWQATAL